MIVKTYTFIKNGTLFGTISDIFENLGRESRKSSQNEQDLLYTLTV